MKLLVTGGSGFIGSAVIRQILTLGTDEVVNVDKLTYAASPDTLRDAESNPAYSFEHADICDADRMADIMESHQPDAIMHLAAESHVDRSIEGPAAFIDTNVVGTYRLLETATRYRDRLTPERREAFRFHMVSTDEVFGSLSLEAPPFSPEHPYDPRSPYSATKAAADHLARAWLHTYGLPVIVSNCSNNYGPYQFPEKLIPMMIISGLDGRPLPVYGQGENIRDWLFVEDHAEALLTVLRRGVPGRTYLIGGGSEVRNIDVVRMLCRLLDDRMPDSAHCPHENLITFVTDRPGHDFRYAIDDENTRRELDWAPRKSFEQGLGETVDWFLNNEWWWRKLMDERYDGRRLGLSMSEEKKA